MPYKDPAKKKAYNKVYMKTYDQRPERIEKRRLYKQTEKYKAYQRNYQKRYKQIHPDVNERSRLHMLTYRANLRYEVLLHYSKGTMKCVKCDNKDEDVLSIDHINNDGAKHRRRIGSTSSTQSYLWLRQHSYPSGFQVLCMNCQIKKQREVLKNASLNKPKTTI